MGDPLTQHLDELEREVERKDGVMQALSDHFAKIYKIVPLSSMGRAAMRLSDERGECQSSATRLSTA